MQTEQQILLVKQVTFKREFLNLCQWVPMERAKAVIYGVSYWASGVENQAGSEAGSLTPSLFATQLRNRFPKFFALEFLVLMARGKELQLSKSIIHLLKQMAKTHNVALAERILLLHTAGQRCSTNSVTSFQVLLKKYLRKCI